VRSEIQNQSRDGQVGVSLRKEVELSFKLQDIEKMSLMKQNIEIKKEALNLAKANSM